MKYIDIPSFDSTIHVSRLAMGSAMSMGALSYEEVFRLYDVFLEYGGNCLDTARYYSRGQAEDMVGQYLASRGNRGRIILSSKGGHPTDEAPEKSRLSREEIIGDLETSLKVLGTDYIDIYWIHKDDPGKPVEELVDIMDEIVHTGKVRMIGVSNWELERIQAANAYAQSKGKQKIQCSQLQWSLTSTKQEYFARFGSVVMTDEMYEWYEKNQIPVFAFSSQAQGFFARIAAKGLDSIPPYLRMQYESPENMKRYERAKQFAGEQGLAVSAAVTGYLINNKLPCVSLIGAENEEMLQLSLKGAEIEMTSEQADWIYAG